MLDRQTDSQTVRQTERRKHSQKNTDTLQHSQPLFKYTAPRQMLVPPNRQSVEEERSGFAYCQRDLQSIYISPNKKKTAQYSLQKISLAQYRQRQTGKSDTTGTAGVVRGHRPADRRRTGGRCRWCRLHCYRTIVVSDCQ